MTSGFEVGARGVQRGRVAGRAAADDDHVLDVRHGFARSVTSLCIVRRSAFTSRQWRRRRSSRQRSTRPAQLEVGDRRRGSSAARTRTRGRRAPRRPPARRRRRSAAKAPIMPPSTPPIAAGQRQQVAEHADEVGHDEHRDRRRLAERVEARPQHGDVERPVDDRAEQRRVARADEVDRGAHAGRAEAGTVASRCGEPRRCGPCPRPALEPALEVGRARARSSSAERDQRSAPKIAGTTVSANGAAAGEDARVQPEAADDQREPCTTP